MSQGPRVLSILAPVLGKGQEQALSQGSLLLREKQMKTQARRNSAKHQTPCLQIIKNIKTALSVHQGNLY